MCALQIFIIIIIIIIIIAASGLIVWCLFVHFAHG